GATSNPIPQYMGGKIIPVKCYFKNGHRLPVTGLYELVVRVLERTSDIETILKTLIVNIRMKTRPPLDQTILSYAMSVLEVLVSEGWVDASFDPSRPKLSIGTGKGGRVIGPHRDFSSSTHETAP